MWLISESKTSYKPPHYATVINIFLTSSPALLSPPRTSPANVMRWELMAPSRFYSKEYYLRARAVVVLLLLISFSYVASMSASRSGSTVSTERFNPERVAIGSRPPSCMNKCFKCRPCAVTLVIPPPTKKSFTQSFPGEDEEGYYLLSWRCRCGNRLFNP